MNSLIIEESNERIIVGDRIKWPVIILALGLFSAGAFLVQTSRVPADFGTSIMFLFFPLVLLIISFAIRRVCFDSLAQTIEISDYLLGLKWRHKQYPLAEVRTLLLRQITYWSPGQGTIPFRYLVPAVELQYDGVKRLTTGRHKWIAEEVPDLLKILKRRLNIPLESKVPGLSSTVGSEAWNSRDLKSRPH